MLTKLINKCSYYNAKYLLSTSCTSCTSCTSWEYNLNNEAQKHYLKNNDIESANNLYLNALSNKKGKISGDLNFYYSHFLLNCCENYELSLKYCENAISLSNMTPPISPSYILLSTIYALYYNDIDKSKKYFNIAINEICDDNLNSYFKYGQILNIIGDYKSNIMSMDYAKLI